MLPPLLALSLALVPQDTPNPSVSEPPPARLELEFRVSPLADLWFDVRHRAAEGQRDPLLDPAIAAMRVLERELGSPLFFGWVEGHLLEATDAEALLTRFGELPETQSLRGLSGPVEVPLRASASAVAAALVELEPRWLQTRWGPRRDALEEEAVRLTQRLASEAGRDALAFLLAGFQLPPPAEPVPVLLVRRGPEPGAVTHRRRGGGGVAFVATDSFPGSLLDEAVLHEALHAVDVLGRESLVTRLRAALGRAGVGRRDPRQRDWVHALFFLHAADTVRRFLDDEHLPYGEARGAYVRMGSVIGVLRPLWESHGAGELGEAGLIERVVEAVGRAE